MPETKDPFRQDASKLQAKSNEIEITFRFDWTTAIATVAILIAIASAYAVFNARRAAARAMEIAAQAQKDAERNKGLSEPESWTIPPVRTKEPEPNYAEDQERDIAAQPTPDVTRTSAPAVGQARPVQYGEYWSTQQVTAVQETTLVSDASTTTSLPVNEPKPHPRRGRIVKIFGAGSTYANPLLQRWAGDYRTQDPELELNYQAIGSDAGFKQMTAGNVDFSVVDSPMTDEQVQRTGGSVVHVPAVLNAVVLVYNLPTMVDKVRFSPEMIFGIFMGRITRWTDPVIAAANPGVRFPELDIHPVHRSDNCSETYIFTDYLSRTSQEWADRVKQGTSVAWPTPLSGKGNDGVVSAVGQELGAVGYISWQFRPTGQVPNVSLGSVKNAAGIYVSATPSSLSTAASAIGDLPDDLRFTISNAPGLGSYPITGITFLLARIGAVRADGQPFDRPESDLSPQDQLLREREFFEFVNWMLDRGQVDTQQLKYAPLPHNLAVKIRQKLFRQEEVAAR